MSRQGAGKTQAGFVTKGVLMKKLIGMFLALMLVLVAVAQPAVADRGRSGGYHGHGSYRGHSSYRGHGGYHGHGGHDGGHVGIGVYLGPGWWGPGWWGPYPYYPYYPYSPVPTVIQQPSTEIYVQPAPQAEESRYWYYCQESQGYYPDVQRCPEGWLKVVPPENPPE